MPTQFVRIRDTTSGVETSVSESRAKQLADRGGVEILKDVKATDALGRPLPASKAKTTVKSKEQAR